MSEIHIVAIFEPKEGKLERLRELLAGISGEVHSKEDGTSRYLLTEQIGSKNPKLILIETYKSAEALKKHGATEHFKSFGAKLQKEDLIGKPPYIVRTVTKAGFDLDRKLVSSKL